jgi:hypothetical protein
MTLQEKTLKIVRRLLVLTTEKSCTWKYERLLINDNHQALFFDSFKTELKSGWVCISKNQKESFVIGFGKNDSLIYSECYENSSHKYDWDVSITYPLLRTLYKEIITLTDPEGEIIDLLLEELKI